MRTDAQRQIDANRQAQRNDWKIRPFRKEVRHDNAAVEFRGAAFEMPPEMARHFADWFCECMNLNPLGHEDREVYVQPFPGHYGLGGYLFTINGSPTRGTMMVQFGGLGCGQVLLCTSELSVSKGRQGRSGREGRLFDEAIGYVRQLGLPETSGNIVPVPPRIDAQAEISRQA